MIANTQTEVRLDGYLPHLVPEIYVGPESIPEHSRICYHDAVQSNDTDWRSRQPKINTCYKWCSLAKVNARLEESPLITAMTRQDESSLGWYLDICSESELEATIESVPIDHSLTSHLDVKPKFPVGPSPMSANITVPTRAVAEDRRPLNWDLTLSLESEPAFVPPANTSVKSISLEHHTVDTELAALTPGQILESPNGSLQDSTIPTSPSLPEIAGKTGSRFRSTARSGIPSTNLKERVIGSVSAVHKDPCFLSAKLSVSAEDIREAPSRPSEHFVALLSATTAPEDQSAFDPGFPTSGHNILKPFDNPCDGNLLTDDVPEVVFGPPDFLTSSFKPSAHPRDDRYPPDWHLVLHAKPKSPLGSSVKHQGNKTQTTSISADDHSAVFLESSRGCIDRLVAQRPGHLNPSFVSSASSLALPSSRLTVSWSSSSAPQRSPLVLQHSPARLWRISATCLGLSANLCHPFAFANRILAKNLTTLVTISRPDLTSFDLRAIHDLRQADTRNLVRGFPRVCAGPHGLHPHHLYLPSHLPHAFPLPSFIPRLFLRSRLLFSSRF